MCGELPSAAPPVRVQVMVPKAKASERVYDTRALFTKEPVTGAVAEITGAVISYHMMVFTTLVAALPAGSLPLNVTV